MKATNHLPEFPANRAIFHNTTLGENYTLRGVKDIATAWGLVEFACSRTGWNPIDVTKISFSN